MGRPTTGLVVFDLDGTLVRGMTSCEVVARSLGRLGRMRELERRVSREEIEAARREMAHWYAAVDPEELTRCLSGAVLAPGALEGIELLRSRGVAVAIASITWDFAVGWFARRLSIDRFLATRLGSDGRIGHVWPEDKARWMEELAGELGLDGDRVAAVGDSVGDAAMLGAARYAVYVGTELPPGLERAKHIPSGHIAEVARWVLAELERHA